MRTFFIYRRRSEYLDKEDCCKEKHIGYHVHTLDNMIGRLISAYQTKLGEKEGITQMQGWILGYLYHHSDIDVFQKDLESEFHIARSTATGILQLMEKKDLITRESIPRDARLKRLVLTARGNALHMKIVEGFDTIEHVLTDDIPREKLDVFHEVVEQVKTNIENYKI